jgi:hypothetical protein
VTVVTGRRDAGHSRTFRQALNCDVLFCRNGTMKVQRQKKHRTLTRAAPVLSAVTILVSLLAIQQVWAGAFCACDHKNPPSSASEHRGIHAAQHQHCEAAHVAATQERAEPACGHHHPSRDTEASGSSATARFEAAMNISGGDGSTTPAKWTCCHIMPAVNLPASSVAVYSANASPDPTPVVFEIGAAGTVVRSPVLHPPRARPVYLAVSSLLI